MPQRPPALDVEPPPASAPEWPAVRPYPEQYVTREHLRDGTEITLRPICPEDEPLMVRFHQTLSERTTYMRYFQVLQLARRTAHERLERICHVDYDRQFALVAERRDPDTGEPQIIGVGRLSRLENGTEAEFAIVISDAFQHQGLGMLFVQRLIQIARDQGLRRIMAVYLPENAAIRAICHRAGMRIVSGVCDSPVMAVLDL